MITLYFNLWLASVPDFWTNEGEILLIYIQVDLYQLKLAEY